MKLTFLLPLFLLFSANVYAAKENVSSELSDLKNFQVNTAKMFSSGLPTKAHFKILKVMGVNNVIDLIPGDRTKESTLTKTLELNYHNIAVDWDNPTLENFKEYVLVMEKYNQNGGITLTHCRLNWRGAAFTYLYRVTQLNEVEEVAKADMLDIWQPDQEWQSFIDEVKANYKQ